MKCLKKIERLAIERAYKIYHGKDLDYKEYLKDIRNNLDGDYWGIPVKQAIEEIKKEIEKENEKGFTQIEYAYDRNRDNSHIYNLVATHFRNLGLKTDIYDSGWTYQCIRIKW